MIRNPGSLTAYVFAVLLVWQIGVAWRGDWATVEQMRKHTPFGLPVLWHGSIWGAAILIPLMSTTVRRFGSQWSPSQIMIALSIGLVAGIGASLAWRQGTMPEAHQKTSAGIPLAIQFGLAVAILFAFFVFSSTVPVSYAITVTALMVVYVFLSTHVPLYWIGPSWYNGDPIHDPGTWIALVGSAALMAAGCVYLSYH